MTQPAEPNVASHALDFKGCVAIDAHCVSCGYNLRTLPAEAVCPECAHPVANSIRGAFLRFGDPQWVRGLARGLLYVLIAVGSVFTIGPLISMMVFVIALAFDPNAFAAPSREVILASGVAQFIVNSVITGFAIHGLMLATRPDADFDPSQEKTASARRTTRFMCYLLPFPLLVGLAQAIYTPQMPQFTPGGPPPNPANIFTQDFLDYILFSFLAGVLSIAIYGVAIAAFFGHVANLLRRIPKATQATIIRICAWVVLAGSLLTAVGYGVMAFSFGPFMTSVTTMATTAPATMPATAPAVTTAAATSPTTQPSPVTVTLQPTALGPGVTTTLPATAPAAGAAPPLPVGAMTGFAVGGIGGGVGGCAGLLATLVGLIVVIMACTQFFSIAKEAARLRAVSSAAESAGTEPENSGEPPNA